jgi:hypothetical protein
MIGGITKKVGQCYRIMRDQLEIISKLGSTEY